MPADNSNAASNKMKFTVNVKFQWVFDPTNMTWVVVGCSVDEFEVAPAVGEQTEILTRAQVESMLAGGELKVIP